jgi:hypothetical protein
LLEGRTGTQIEAAKFERVLSHFSFKRWKSLKASAESSVQAQGQAVFNLHRPTLPPL